MTVFEIWIHLIAITVFTILLVLKIDADTNWWIIFSPLFGADALNAYFCIIVFIRMQLENSLKVALLRASWSATFLLMTFLFKFLLCKKLMGQVTLEYSEIFAPMFILLQLIAVRACQLTH